MGSFDARTPSDCERYYYLMDYRTDTTYIQAPRGTKSTHYLADVVVGNLNKRVSKGQVVLDGYYGI